MASFSEWLFGSPDKIKKVPTGNEFQQSLHDSILSQVLGMSQQGGGYNLAQNYFNNLLGQNSQDAYNQFSAPYLQQFQEQILPQIAERFAGSGSLSSSGFGQALGGSASNLQGQLAQLFAELQKQAAGAQTNQYNQLAQQGLNYQPFAYQNQRGSSGFLGNFGLGLGNTTGNLLGNSLGGIESLFKQNGNLGM